MEIEGTELHQSSIDRAVNVAKEAGQFVLDRVVFVPFVMELEEAPEQTAFDRLDFEV